MRSGTMQLLSFHTESSLHAESLQLAIAVGAAKEVI